MYSCPGCGSQMLFDIAGQQLKCGRCDRTMSIEEADGKEVRQAGSHKIFRKNGNLIVVPDHRGDLKPGVEADIKKKAGW